MAEKTPIHKENSPSEAFFANEDTCPLYSLDIGMPMHRLVRLDTELPEMPSKTDIAFTVKARRGRPAGSGKNSTGKACSLGYREALDLILASESGNKDLTENQRDEVPAIEVYSIDESFLQLPEGFTEETARALRAKVLQWTGIPVCIGIASAKLLAKAANRHAKKNKAVTGGVFDLTGYWDPDGILSGMETGDLWGVGRNLAQRLRGMGIKTALQFKQADPAAIRKSMGVIGERMFRELNGIPCMELEEMPPDRKGVMASRSFGSPVETLEELEEALANHVARASEKIRRYGLLATRMEVFLRTNRFRKDDPQYCPGVGITLDRPTNSTAELMAQARDLLHRIYRPGYRYKKTGIQLAHLVSEDEHQPELFDRPKARIEVDKIVDEINRRMGDPKNPVITRASQGTLRSGKGWRMRSERHSPHYTTSWQELPEAG